MINMGNNRKVSNMLWFKRRKVNVFDFHDDFVLPYKYFYRKVMANREITRLRGGDQNWPFG